MPNSTIIALSSTGLHLSDISARVIRNGVRSITDDGAMTLEAIGGVGSLRYKLTGVVDGGLPHALTWDDGNGQLGAYEYGFVGTPTYVIIPTRSQSTIDGVWLYRNNVDVTNTVTLTSTYISSGVEPELSTPDIKLSGWPVYLDGAVYVLLYSISGVIYTRLWTALLLPTSETFTGTFIEILARQHPFDTGVDGSGRQTMSVNFDVWIASPVSNWRLGIVKLLADASLATYGTDTFIGQIANIPTDAGPYLTLVDTGGLSPLECHTREKIERLSLQVYGVAADVVAVDGRMTAIYELLDGIRGVQVTV